MKSIKPEVINQDSLIILKETVSTLRLVVDELTSYGSDEDDAKYEKLIKRGEEFVESKKHSADELLLEIFNASRGDWNAWLEKNSFYWDEKVKEYFNCDLK